MFSNHSAMLPFVVTATVVTSILIVFLVSVLIIFKNRQNRKSREYLTSLIDERDRTMHTISLEVHDNISQMLNVARINLHNLEDIVDEKSLPAVQKIGEIIETIIIDSDNIGHTLNTDYLKQKGLVTSLKETVAWVNSSKKICCELQINGKTRRLAPQVEVMLFRIGQEALNNSIKYAKAKQIDVILSYKNTSVTLEIVDNGRGFNQNDDKFIEGVGMLSMRQRTKIINGTLNIESIPTTGTKIIVSIYDTAH